MAILQNLFVKGIVIPILFACAAVLLESISALVKGRSKGELKYRAWIRQQRKDGESIFIPVPYQSLEQIRKREDIIDIEPMVKFDLADFASLGVDLVVGAFAVDVASLVETQGDPALTGYVLVAHIFSLIGIILFVMLNQLCGPNEQVEKRTRAAVAIGLGVVAMMLSFLVL